MKLLVLGGTSFLGRHIVEAALPLGWDVTLFNRGRTAPELFTGARKLIGDRRGDHAGLRGGIWDAAVDLSGMRPSSVRTSVRTLAGKVGRYIFISSVSVYREWGSPLPEDELEIHAPPEVEKGEAIGENYARFKVGCEIEVRAAFPDCAVIVRPGLLAGPYDPTDRFTYWPARAARGGEVLAPGNPNRQVQLLDARDLADWVLRLVREGKPGFYNACGRPAQMRYVLDECRAECGADARFTWVDDEFLVHEKVEPYTELPLWIPGVSDGFDTSKARAAGLNCRALRETIRDVFRWDAARPDGEKRNNGLTPAREADLLEKWARISRASASGL